MLHDLEIIDNMPIWLETQTFLQANIARLEELRSKVEDIELWMPSILSRVNQGSKSNNVRCVNCGKLEVIMLPTFSLIFLLISEVAH